MNSLLFKKAAFLICLIILWAVFACSDHTSPQKIIYDDYRYGDIRDGLPDKDTTSNTMDDSGRITGEGKVAVSGTEASLIKVGLWKEFYESGPLQCEGQYNIGSYVDCCAGEACRIFYYYRVGQWKYYDLQGNLLFDAAFTPSRLHIKTRCEGGDSLIFGLIKTIPAEYWHVLTLDKIYEIQKIAINELDRITTFIPLNGELFIDSKKKK